MNKILKELLSNGNKVDAKKALSEEMASALKNKQNGKPQPDLKRHLQGPLQKSTTINGRTYEAKPHKVSGKHDPVQDEANKKLYINGYGQREPGDLNFIDDNGTYYANANSGHNGGVQYSHLPTKSHNNGKSNEKRWGEIETQSHPSVDLKAFDKSKQVGTEAHHMAGLEQFAPVFKGLSEKNRIKMIELLQEKGIFTGNHEGNLASLSTSVHTKFHTWMKQNGLMGPNSDLSKLSFNKRLPYVESLIMEFKKAERQLFDLKMKEKWGESFISSRNLNSAYNKSYNPELNNFAKS